MQYLYTWTKTKITVTINVTLWLRLLIQVGSEIRHCTSRVSFFLREAVFKTLIKKRREEKSVGKESRKKFKIIRLVSLRLIVKLVMRLSKRRLVLDHRQVLYDSRFYSGQVPVILCSNTRKSVIRLNWWIYCTSDSKPVYRLVWSQACQVTHCRQNAWTLKCIRKKYEYIFICVMVETGNIFFNVNFYLMEW